MHLFESLESEVRSYCRSFPVVFATACASAMYTASGERYIDFFSGAGSLNYGHNDPDLVSAIISYIQKNGIIHTLDFYSEAKANFLNTFDSLILKPRNLDYKFQFTAPTGADAVEAAIKLARKITGRSTIACFSGGYHGMSLGALSLTANPDKRALAGVDIPGVLRLPFEGFLDLELEQQLAVVEAMVSKAGCGNDLPAAFVFECVQGEGGLNVASAAWAQGIAALASKIGALVIVDDIQAGCGRSGKFFSFDGLGITPDIVCLSKSLSGIGLPFSINLIARERDLWAAGDHVGTFRGNTLAMVAAEAALKKFWSDDTLADHVARQSTVVRRALTDFVAQCHDGAARVHGRGLMLGLGLSQAGAATRISHQLFEQKLIVETCGPSNEVLKLLPALTIDSGTLAASLELILATAAGVLRAPRHH